ncbi:hypothetical protein chiPu_0006961 [Chiloscyllium punctatum]|uniref:Uncharacterized protein n=1 Tax=Chiloscyllium punctatum TaxID=137246 RepID=A0A401SDR0_CHIPU|nr:hypothetical protein [Chiloscyllium punctatum]
MQRVKCNNEGRHAKNRSKDIPDCPAVIIPFNPYESAYQHDYTLKTSGVRESFGKGPWYEHKRNNPHPDETFMVHHMNRKEVERVPTPRTYWNKYPTEKEIRDILGGDFSTEYQDQFITEIKGLMPKPVLPRPVEQKKEIPHLLITEFRDQYRLPCLNKHLMHSIARNGSNATRDIPPKGIVPAITYAHIKNQENRKKLTTYEDSYSNAHEDLVSFLKSVDIEAIQRELQNSNPSERKALRKFLRNVTARCITQPMKSKIC